MSELSIIRLRKRRGVVREVSLKRRGKREKKEKKGDASKNLSPILCVRPNLEGGKKIFQKKRFT